jgi:hypothetical protein
MLFLDVITLALLIVSAKHLRHFPKNQGLWWGLCIGVSAFLPDLSNKGVQLAFIVVIACSLIFILFYKTSEAVFLSLMISIAAAVRLGNMQMQAVLIVLPIMYIFAALIILLKGLDMISGAYARFYNAAVPLLKTLPLKIVLCRFKPAKDEVITAIAEPE